MQLRFSQGDRTGALHAYATCLSILVEEMHFTLLATLFSTHGR